MLKYIKSPDLKLSSLRGKLIFFEGDSITDGTASTEVRRRWTTNVCVRLGAYERNNGISGKSITPGGVTCGFPILDSSSVPIKINDFGLYVVSLGTNDIGFNNASHSVSAYISALSAIIDSAISKGWISNKIVIDSPGYVEQPGWNTYTVSCASVTTAADLTRAESFRSAALSVAKSKHTLFFNSNSKMINYGNPTQFLSSDKLHPNDLGHKFKADCFVNNLFYIQ